jgi:UDP-2,3-diacylglucosamine pyrophosphatase LpxH
VNRQIIWLRRSGNIWGIYQKPVGKIAEKRKSSYAEKIRNEHKEKFIIFMVSGNIHHPAANPVQIFAVYFVCGMLVAVL